MSPRVMQPRVLHQPRVAWDFALITVMMAEAEHDDYTWFAGGVVEVLGTPGLTALATTRSNLRQPNRPDARQVEAGQWRFRIADALALRPDLAWELEELRERARARLIGG